MDPEIWGKDLGFWGLSGEPSAAALARASPAHENARQEWRAFRLTWHSEDIYAAMVIWACSLQGPRSPVGETQRIHT